MERIGVISSNIDSIGYAENSKLLELEFKSGGVYQYVNVPKGLFVTLMNSSSYGSFFHKWIKDNFTTIKIK